MPHICNFMKQSDHRPCEVQVWTNGDEVCGIHRPIKERMPPLVPDGCEHIVGNHWCRRLSLMGGGRLCETHFLRRERERADRLRNNQAWAAAHAPPVAAPPAPPVDGGGIHRLANDRQNVHTAVIAKQTNAGEAKLLEVKTDGRGVGLRVLRTFAARAGTLQGVMRVMNDVDHWYSTKTCRTVGDRLYGRMLEGLWTLIEQQPDGIRAELKNRLWEEASEAVGMCCEGHLARLVNVMSGFDEAFAPRVSVGEAIQTKIAGIARLEISADEKVKMARVYLTELALTAQEQAPWLEALE